MSRPHPVSILLVGLGQPVAEILSLVLRDGLACGTVVGRNPRPHHVETMGNHCLLVFTGESSFHGFLDDAGFRLSTVSLFMARLLPFASEYVLVCLVGFKRNSLLLVLETFSHFFLGP